MWYIQIISASANRIKVAVPEGDFPVYMGFLHILGKFKVRFHVNKTGEPQKMSKNGPVLTRAIKVSKFCIRVISDLALLHVHDVCSNIQDHCTQH